MGFQLVIAEGKESGREFEFDQDSVVIGRTAECDVILYEAGVSRQHARIAIEPAGISIEDLGSSNGTRVNTETIKGKTFLKDGDTISMGPVVFNFKPKDLEPEEEAPLAEGGAHTRIISVSELKKSRNKGVAMLPRDASREEVVEMGRRSTQMLPVMKATRPSTPGRKPPSPEARPATKLAVREDDLPQGVEVAGGGRPRLVRTTGEQVALSASDRARLKRGGVVGQGRLWWTEAPLAKRIAVSVVASVVTLGLLGGMIFAVIPDDAKPRPKEPEVLSGEPIEYSFGLGEGVMFTRSDSKTFDFEVKSPVQVMVVLHYMARDINSKDEVSITVNGMEVGWLPPDTMDVAERTLEVIIPANLVKRGEINTVTFDNMRNPPEEDAWRIWSLWIEVAVLPERDEVGLIADAEEHYRRGNQEWEQRDIGASNRWDAYKNYREAWLTLEALPQQARPYTYSLARDKMNESKRALDDKCKELIRKARSAYELNKVAEAISQLDYVKQYFPTRAHPCQYRAEIERESMQ